MADYQVFIEDQPEPVEDAIVTVAVERFPYVVAAEHGLFKNGQQYAQGEQIMLDRATAARFLASGDIQEA